MCRLRSSLLFPRGRSLQSGITYVTNTHGGESAAAYMHVGAVGATSRLTPFEHNFHNDMRKREIESRAVCCGGFTWYTEQTAADDHRVPTLYIYACVSVRVCVLRNQYSFGDNERRGEPPTTMSTMWTALTLCLFLYVAKTRAARSLKKKEREFIDV